MAIGVALGTPLVLLLWLAAVWSKTFAPVGSPELRLEADAGSVVVTAVDRADIAVQVSTTGWKISETEVQVQDRLAGNRLELRVIVPKEGAGFSRHGLRIAIQVPRGIGCEIKTGEGGITVEGVSGQVKLTTAAGSIRGVSLDGKFEASTGQGRIQTSGRFDALTLTAGFGAIEAVALAGSKMFGAWRLGTKAGNISLRLPEGFAADVDAEASLGKVVMDVPLVYSGAPDLAHVRGSMNGGGELLRVRAEGGNIRIIKPVSK